MAALPYLLIAGSALLERKNQRDVEGRQKRIIDAMQQYQTGKAKQGQKSIEDFLQTITPERRAAESADTRQELQRGLEQSVGATQAYEKPDNFSGKVSDAYSARRAEGDAATKERVRKAMEQLAVIGSPAEQGLRQQFRFGRAAGDVDAANAAIRNVTPAYEGAI